MSEEKPLHTSSDKQYWDRKANKVKLVGHATVRQPGETLTADTIDMDLNTHVLDARGNCVYVTIDSVIEGEEMHFNLDTRTGTIVGGRVSNEKFALSGERINKLASDRFQTHWGEYTTCRDCPRSWSLLAEDVDMQIEGYAYMDNVTTKIADTPALWLPYMVVPMKTHRQSGVLFPHISFSSIYGGVLTLPYYWAINRSSDMTFAAGTYTALGPRAEWQGRYALSKRSGGRADFFYLHDSTFALQPALNTFIPKPDRWGLNVVQTQELPWHIEEKFKFTDVSDNLYPDRFPLDIDRQNEMVLSQELIFSYASPQVSGYVAGRRLRNLLNGEYQPFPSAWETDFDPETVQVFPTAAVTTNDQFLGNLPKFLGDLPMTAGVSVGISNFTRTAGPFDYDPTYHQSVGEPINFGTPNPSPYLYVPGVDPVREATRLSFSPSIYTSTRLWDVVSVVPSARYFAYYYNFHEIMKPLYRDYLLTQLDLSAQMEKVYDTGNPDQPKIKHLIRPLVTYSYVPYNHQSNQNHPFIGQINYANTNGITGYNFDDSDIVPIDRSILATNNYFVPIGNSIQFGFTTQLIKRIGKIDAPDASYLRMVELTAGEAIDLRELGPNWAGKTVLPPIGPVGPEPLMRYYTTLDFNLGRLTSSNTYYYYPYLFPWHHHVSTAWSYIFERALHSRIMSYDRSVTLGYTYDLTNCTIANYGSFGCGTSDATATLNFSINDYIMPQLTAEYNFVAHQFLGATLALLFQSPSQCWRFTPNMSYNINNHSTLFSFNLELNLSGTGFGAVSDLASQAMAH